MKTAFAISKSNNKQDATTAAQATTATAINAHTHTRETIARRQYARIRSETTRKGANFNDSAFFEYLFDFCISVDFRGIYRKISKIRDCGG